MLDNAVVLAPSLRAMALRGRGLQLIELGNLDEAEQCFLESLTIDPDSPVARKELEYIEHLRSGGEAAPLETAVWPKSAPLTCAVCGAETLLNAPDGSDKVICESCMQRGSAVLGCGCIANQVLCDGFSVVVVKEPCPAHVADKDVIQQLLPPDPNPTSLVQAGLHALYFGKTGGCESAPPLKYADKILSGLATDKHVLLELFGNDVRHAAVAAMASNIVRRGKQ